MKTSTASKIITMASKDRVRSISTLIKRTSLIAPMRVVRKLAKQGVVEYVRKGYRVELHLTDAYKEVRAFL